MNRVTLIGYVGKDPDIRQTKAGKSVANFSLATTDSWKDKSSGEKKEKTEWHRCVCWIEGLIPIIQNYVSKGSRILVEGQLTTREYTDKEGNTKYTTEVMMSGFNARLMLLSKGDHKEERSTQTSTSQMADPFELDDQIPDFTQ